jgi:hypothetical protein
MFSSFEILLTRLRRESEKSSVRGGHAQIRVMKANELEAGTWFVRICLSLTLSQLR